MLDIETQLRTYGEAVERAALVAPLQSSLEDDQAGLASFSRRGRVPLLAALAAAVLLVGGAGFVRQSRGEGVEAASGASAAQIAEEWAAYAVPAYITDAVPTGMTVSATMSADDYDAPVWTISTQQYWVDGQATPTEADQQLAISWFADDESDSGLYGEPATVRGTEGVFREDAVAFVDDGFQVVLSSSTFSTNELIALAERLTITETGVQPLDDVPGGLTPLPVRRNSSYTQRGATVPVGGHTVTYGDGDRELNIFTSPVDGNHNALGWRADSRQIDVDGRIVWISSVSDHPPTSVTAAWVEGDAQIAILALGLTEEEAIAVIRATRPANKEEW